MSAAQYRILTPPHDGDTVTLACLICWEPFENNDHALIHLADPNPRFDAINQAIETHQHGKETEL